MSEEKEQIRKKPEYFFVLIMLILFIFWTVITYKAVQLFKDDVDIQIPTVSTYCEGSVCGERSVDEKLPVR